MCKLISAFVIRLLGSLISKPASCKISVLKLVSVAEETDLTLALSETTKTGFLALRPIWYVLLCTVKPVLSGHSKIDKTKILMTNSS